MISPPTSIISNIRKDCELIGVPEELVPLFEHCPDEDDGNYVLCDKSEFVLVFAEPFGQFVVCRSENIDDVRYKLFDWITGEIGSRDAPLNTPVHETMWPIKYYLMGKIDGSWRSKVECGYKEVLKKHPSKLKGKFWRNSRKVPNKSKHSEL